jgi:hypothetical protein
LVLRVIADAAAFNAILASGVLQEYLSSRQPLVSLISELARRDHCNQVYIPQERLLLRVEKNRKPRDH